MIERVIILPRRDNDGRSLARVVGGVKQELLAIAGGYSECEQSGAWRDSDGTIYQDRSVRVTTTVDDEQDAAIVARLPEWCERLRQICLYTHRADVQADFVYAPIQQSLTA